MLTSASGVEAIDVGRQRLLRMALVASQAAVMTTMNASGGGKPMFGPYWTASGERQTRRPSSDRRVCWGNKRTGMKRQTRLLKWILTVGF
jgi:hypothetical protein